MTLVRLRMKPYIQPFERRLALQELRVIANAEPKSLGLLEETSTEFELVSMRSGNDLASRLAYWESVHTADISLVTMQSLRESTVSASRNELELDTLRLQFPVRGDVTLPSRRCLRYGPHGIHEYRGKFFPQLVRSLINVAGIEPGGIVGDPMSGSGTTIVEAVLAGNRGFGLDMNPLSVFLGRVKSKLLSMNPSSIATSFARVQRELSSSRRSNAKRLRHFENLPEADQKYLSAWFSVKVLGQLDQIVQSIESVRDADVRDFMRVALSNVLRRVSWQKEDDLRVRKEIRPDTEIDAIKEFLEELERSTRSVLAFSYQNGSVEKGRFRISQGDARQCNAIWGDSSLDVVITSPPYATALPYLDTDRLSLCYLGMLPRPEHRTRDQQMIGNREVTEGLRRSYWKWFEENSDSLPESVCSLIRRIEVLNSSTAVGFRRRNLPALLAKYFFDMKEVLEGIHRALKPKSHAFVVVGNNHTIAGGQHVDIHTASLLQDIARGIGFHVSESLAMEMLISRDIFKKNATASEEILALYKTS